MKLDLGVSLTSALSGLQVGVDRARAAAGEVAKLTAGSDSAKNVVKPLLELQKAKQEVGLNAKVIQVQDETLGRLVDKTA